MKVLVDVIAMRNLPNKPSGFALVAPIGLPFMPEESFRTLGLRRGPWKYVGGHKEELYNLESNIDETKNVISQFPEVAAEMHKTLTKVKQEGRIRKNRSSSEWPGDIR